MSGEDIFYQKLQNFLKKRKTIDLKELWKIYRSCPIYKEEDVRLGLSQILDKLSKQGKITLPSVRGHLWDKDAFPAIPLSIGMVNSNIIKSSISSRDYIWSPELSQLSDFNYVSGLDAWISLDSWIKRNRKNNRQLIKVGKQERSFDIFDDEKFLADHFEKRSTWNMINKTPQDLLFYFENSVKYGKKLIK